MELAEKDKRLTTFLAEKEKAEIASDAWDLKTRKYGFQCARNIHYHKVCPQIHDISEM